MKERPNRTYTYRSKEEIEDWMKKCPIKRFRNVLLEKGVVEETGLKEIEKDILIEIEEAIQFAQESPEPNPEDALKDLYCS